MNTAEFKYLLYRLLSFTLTIVHQQSFQAFSQSCKQVTLHFLAKAKHPFGSQYSLINDVSDVMLMMLWRQNFGQILIDQIKINRTIFKRLID